MFQGKIDFIATVLCGIRSNRGILWWKSSGQLQLDKTELIVVLWWRLRASRSVISVGGGMPMFLTFSMVSLQLSGFHSKSEKID